MAVAHNDSAAWFRPRDRFGALRGLIEFFIGLVFVFVSAHAANVPERLDFIVTASGTFSNVTIVNLTETHVTVRGADGSVATLKRADLDNATQARLRGEVVAAEKSKAGTVASSDSRAVASPGPGGTNNIAMNEAVEQARVRAEELLQRFSPEKVGMALLVGFFAVSLAFYLFGCYCLMLICKKTGNEPGFLIWLPILQTFPMLRAASMSYGWALAIFSPQLGAIGLAPILPPALLLMVVLGLAVLSIATCVFWCFKITQARGKHWVVAILLILPVASLFAFLYLAFSKGVEEEGGSSESAPPLPA